MAKGIIAFVLIMFVGVVVFNVVSYFHTTEITTQVTGKERITQQNGDKVDSFYLIYTDHGAVSLEDDFFRGNWNSSDVYGNLHIGSTYTFKISGFRIGFFSMYPNIIEVK